MGSFSVTPNHGGTFTLHTLGVSPHPNLEKIRMRACRTRFGTADLTALNDLRHWVSPITSLRSHQWELKCALALKGNCRIAGLNIFHSSNDTTNMSRVYFESADGRITVEKASVRSVNGANLAPDSTRHPLFMLKDVATGIEVEEELHMHFFYDQSVLEVFFNERTVVTSRLYPISMEGISLQLFAEGMEEVDVAPLEVQGVSHMGWTQGKELMLDTLFHCVELALEPLSRPPAGEPWLLGTEYGRRWKYHDESAMVIVNGALNI